MFLHRVTIGFRRDEKPFCSWLLNNVRTPFLVFVISFHARHVQKQKRLFEVTCRIQNPNITRAGPDGAHGRAMCRGLSELDADMTVRPGNKTPSYFPPVESKTRTYHGRVGSGRTAGRTAGPGRTERRQNSSPRKQASLVPPKASRTRPLNVFPEARTSKILYKPNAGTKSAVDKRFVTGL